MSVTPLPQVATSEYLLDEQVGYILRLVSQRHAAIFQAGVVEGLTPTQFSALVRLGEVGTCSQNQLGRLTAMDVATIKGVVDRLSRKGLVTLEPDPNDRRRLMISLSDQGNALLGDLHRAGHQITRDTLAPLTAEEVQTLLTLLGKLA